MNPKGRKPRIKYTPGFNWKLSYILHFKKFRQFLLQESFLVILWSIKGSEECAVLIFSYHLWLYTPLDHEKRNCKEHSESYQILPTYFKELKLTKKILGDKRTSNITQLYIFSPRSTLSRLTFQKMDRTCHLQAEVKGQASKPFIWV